MMQTLRNYLLANYGIECDENVQTAFKTAWATPDSLLTGPLEFASDCVWLAKVKMPEFLEQLEKKRFDKTANPNDQDVMYYDEVREWGKQILSMTRATWESHDKKPKTDQAIGIILTYIALTTIPCSKPGRLLALCQLNKDLAEMLKACERETTRQSEHQRRQYFQDEFFPKAIKIMNQGDPENLKADMVLRDPEIQKYYFQAAANLLRLTPPY